MQRRSKSQNISGIGARSYLKLGPVCLSLALMFASLVIMQSNTIAVSFAQKPVQAESTLIYLQGITIDTAQEVLKAERTGNYQDKISGVVPRISGAYAEVQRLYIIQMRSRIHPDWTDAIEKELSVKLCSYLPDNAFIIKATMDQILR